MDHDIITELAEQIAQQGRDQMAQLLANALLDLTADDDQAYIDGFEDALNTLVQAGASDPR